MRNRHVIPKTSKTNQRGSAMLEGAFVFGAFLMIIFGIVDFSRAVYHYNSLTWGAVEGARYASVHGSASGSPATATTISNYVKPKLIGMSSATVGATWQDASSKAPGTRVTVEVNYNFTPVVPYVPGGTWPLKGTATMLISQ